MTVADAKYEETSEIVSMANHIKLLTLELNKKIEACIFYEASIKELNEKYDKLNKENSLLNLRINTEKTLNSKLIDSNTQYKKEVKELELKLNKSVNIIRGLVGSE